MVARSKSFDKHLKQIFKGKDCNCRKTFANFKNCCKDDGWGLDASLTECDAEEQQLGELKKNKVCHEVGEYCSKEVLGNCVERKKSYCCFGSKLSRIVHEQGRQQLDLTWGSPKHPECRGLTPDELQKINFKNMNLSEFYQDIQKKVVVPNPSNLQERIKERVQGGLK